MNSMFKSSLGKKLIMSLAGVFLVLFLLVHLGLNLVLIFTDSREAFNRASHFMATNPVVKVLEVILFAGFMLHMVYGIYLQFENWLARPKRYKVENFSQTSFFSKFMFHTAIIIAVFLVIHLIDFYFISRFSPDMPMISYEGEEYPDMGILVLEKFKMPGFVVLYIASFIFLAFHLLHGFQSAFQTMGVNHRLYSPVVYYLGIGYSILVSAGFILIPVYIYFWM